MSSVEDTSEWPEQGQRSVVEVGDTWAFRFACGDCGERLESHEQTVAQQEFEDHIISHVGPAKIIWGWDDYFTVSR